MSGIFDEIIEYGLGGYDPAQPNNNVVSTHQIELPVRDANERDVRDKAKAALALNATYLAIATPTGAQNAAQAKALTRQVNGIIRLLLGALEDVSDT